MLRDERANDKGNTVEIAMFNTLKKLTTDFVHRSLSPRRVNVFALALLPLYGAILYAAFWFRFDGLLGELEWMWFASSVGWIVLIKAFVFAWLRAYRGWSRYVTFHDLIVLVKCATVSSVLLVLIDYFFWPSMSMPRSVLLMDWAITILSVGSLRSVSRLLKERVLVRAFSRAKDDVFIVGTDNSGEALLRAIRRSSQMDYHVVGFIATQSNGVEAHVDGVPVVGNLDATCALAKKHHVSEVLITHGNLSGKQVRELVEDASTYNVNVKVLPSYEQLLDGKVDLQPRQVSIEDVLQRDPVSLDQGELHRWLDDQVLLVTGSAGSIGSEICRQLLQFSPRKLVLVDRSENGQFFLERELRRLSPDTEFEFCIASIDDDQRMRWVFEQHQPNIVFHAAAYKHVPLMESNPGEGVKNIPVATRVLADLAHEFQINSFVMISTDKAVNPTSVMGTCKRVAELYIQALAQESPCRFVTVRFGNVLDSAGSVVPIFREQIARGGPVTVTHPEMRRFFMTIPEASQLVIQAGAMGEGGEIFVLDMGQPVKIVDLASDLIRLSGLQVGRDIDIQFSGIRPGEKLFEELHVDGEQHKSTSHPKIMVAEGETLDIDVVSARIDLLRGIANGAPELVIQELREFIPQYQRADHQGLDSTKTLRDAA